MGWCRPTVFRDTSERSAISRIWSPRAATCAKRRPCTATPSTRRPIGIAYADRDGKFLRFNDAFCTLLGFNAAEFTDKSIGELTHAEDAASARVQLDRLWSGEIQFVDIEKRYRRKDGSFVWVRTSTALVRDGSRAECSVEYLRDITHRKELAAALLQQQTLLEAVLTDLPVALLVCDVAGNITHYNRAAVDLYCIPKHAPSSQDPYPLAADVYLMDGVTAVDRANRPLACALARRDDHQPRTSDRAARLATGALHVVECAPADRPGRADPRRGRRHSGRDGSEAPGDGTRARAQGADDGLPPGRHGRGRHECAAQRRQHPEQRQHLGESRRRARQAIEGARCIAPRRPVGRAGPPRGPVHHRRRTRAAHTRLSRRARGTAARPISG